MFRLILPFLLITGSVVGQTLPEEWQLLPEVHQIKVGKTTESGLYQTDVIKTINLQFEAANWASQLATNYNTENYVTATLTYDGEVLGDVGVQYKGQTSYMMLPPGSQKKSFSIKTDLIAVDQELLGYSNLNLNNAFQDATFMREFLYCQLIRKHIPTAKANFVHLTINGENWGLYVNVQQLNKDLLKEWFLSNDGTYWRADAPTSTGGGGGGGGGPQWGDGTAGLNYLGTNPATYQQYYTLKNTEETDPWALLINTCDVLNNTSLANLPVALPEVMDVDRALWLMACEIAFCDDDGYIYKGKMDYYVHWEKETGRSVPLEFDGNSVLTTQNQAWGPFYHADNVNYPVMNRLMQVPEYRQRYLAHLRTIINEMLDLTTTQNFISEYSQMIDAEVESDPKKIYTYSQFTTGLVTLQNVINTRRNTLNANAEVNTQGPEISNVMASGAQGQWDILINETPTVTATVTSPDGLANVWLHYSDQLVGNFTKIAMTDQGSGNYAAQLPGIVIGGLMRFYIEAVENNAAGTRSYLPVGADHDVFYYIAMPEKVDSDVVINEIMAKNNTTAQDEAGQFEDWIEIYNKGTEAIEISDWYLSDNLTNLDKWTFPSGVILQPDAYMIVWADEDASDGPLHANFKLTTTGENLTLMTSDIKIADQVFFGPQQADMGYARMPNGTGDFVIQGPTFNAFNGAVNVGEALTQTGMAIFPNPVRDNLRIVFSDPIETDIPWTLTTLSGQTASSGTLFGGTNSYRIPVSGLASGMYLLLLHESSGSTGHRIIID